jgi:hypothetical protein
MRSCTRTATGSPGSPLVKIERGKIARIRQALEEAGLLGKNACDAA